MQIVFIKIIENFQLIKVKETHTTIILLLKKEGFICIKNQIIKIDALGIIKRMNFELYNLIF